MVPTLPLSLGSAGCTLEGVGSWIAFAVIVVVAAFGLFVLFRSLRRWKQPAATSPEAKEAEARLWQTRLGEQR